MVLAYDVIAQSMRFIGLWTMVQLPSGARSVKKAIAPVHESVVARSGGAIGEFFEAC